MKEIVDIKGKQYETVASRVQRFIEEKKNYKITTEIIQFDSSTAVIKAYILNENNEVMATGHAFEIAGENYINKTSYLENAETSAVGRALAFFGYAGSEIASADEVTNAINNQKVDLRINELIQLAQPVIDKLRDSQRDFLMTIQKPNYQLSKANYDDVKKVLQELNK